MSIHSPSGNNRIGAASETGLSPRYVGEFDLAQPARAFEAPPGYERALVLVRHDSVLLGVVPVELGAGSYESAVRQAIAAHLSVDYCAIEDSRARQTSAVDAGPSVSVVVCTKNRERQLSDCLDALCAQEYPRYEIVVVDNTEGSPGVAEIVDRLDTRVEVRLVVEPESGLARARNRGALVSKGSVVAYIDDDARPTENWITELAVGYFEHPEAASVNGSIYPSSIETEAQEFFFQFGGHSKGRGFEPQIIDPSAPGSQNALYPLPPFGAGGNMSVRRSALINVGGFDEALGAGTPACGGEETELFTRLLLAGYTIVYWPFALVWHADRAEFTGLVKQMRALGTSLTAYYTSIVVRDPRLLPRLLALVPRATRDLRGASGSVRTATMSAGFPRELMQSNRRGMRSGPMAYLRGRRHCRGRCRAILEPHSDA